MATEKRYNLPTFRAMLSGMTHRTAELSPDTHKRYKRGILPQTLIDLLISRPELADALCADLKQSQQDSD